MAVGRSLTLPLRPGGGRWGITLIGAIESLDLRFVHVRVCLCQTEFCHWNIEKRKTCSVHAVTFTALEANPIPLILTDEFLPLSPTRRQHSNINLNRCAALKEVRMPNESRSTTDDSSTVTRS